MLIKRQKFSEFMNALKKKKKEKENEEAEKTKKKGQKEKIKEKWSCEFKESLKYPKHMFRAVVRYNLS